MDAAVDKEPLKAFTVLEDGAQGVNCHPYVAGEVDRPQLCQASHHTCHNFIGHAYCRLAQIKDRPDEQDAARKLITPGTETTDQNRKSVANREHTNENRIKSSYLLNDENTSARSSSGR